MTADIVTLALEDDLNTALKRFTATNHDELPVVDAKDGILLGIMRRREVIAAYNRRMADYRASDDEKELRLGRRGWQMAE